MTTIRGTKSDVTHSPFVEDSVITTSQPPMSVAASLVPVVAPDSKALFLKLFSSRCGSYARTAGSATWRKLSQFHQLSDQELLESISKESKAYRALTLEQSESFLILQFQSVGRDEDREIWEKLSAALSTAGISGLKLFQVAEKSTYQAFIYFSKSATIAPLSKGLANHLAQAGVTNVEVLKPGDNFIMPLQEGYRWMNNAVLPVIARHEMTEDMALNFFIGEVTKTICCPEQLLGQFKEFLAAEAKREIMEIVPPAADGVKAKRKERRLKVLP